MEIIKIIFRPKDALTLPYAHFRILQGFFYRLLSFDEKLSGEIHNKKDGDADAIKLFSFSDVIGNYINENRSLIYRDRFALEIRSTDTDIIDTLRARTESGKDYSINGCDCVADSCDIRDTPELPRECIYRMNTPITAYLTEDNFRKYYSAYDSEFNVLIENNLRKKYALVYGKDYGGELSFSAVNPDRCRKCVTKFKKKDTSDDRGEKYLIEYITAYYGEYRLIADGDMQRIAYLCGLGGKNSQGFGFPYLK